MKKYYLIGIAILLAGLFAYHFIAENRAEQQIHEAIQETINKPDARWSVQYSSINITAFTGDIVFSDITLLQDKTIQRSRHILVDLSYWDVLKIYVGGLQFGLKQLDEAKISLSAPVWIDRNSLSEIKFGSLNIFYEGNAWDLLLNLNNGSPFKQAHTITAQSPEFVLALPGTTFSQLEAANFTYTGTVESGKRELLPGASHKVQLDSLTWTPSEEFQKTYSFFIKGFGYATDAIPFDAAHLNAAPNSETGLLQIDARLESELARLSACGYLKLDEPLGNSQWHETQLTLTEFSEAFSNVLTNIERLLPVNLPKEAGGIKLQLAGTLSNTSIQQQEK